jgi:hypothetical protein
VTPLAADFLCLDRETEVGFMEVGLKNGIHCGSGRQRRVSARETAEWSALGQRLAHFPTASGWKRDRLYRDGPEMVEIDLKEND